MLYCSICIPCFKRLEQVEETLKSIYELNSDVPLSEFEVVVSDNDPDQELNSALRKYLDKPNFRYVATNCEGFMNSYFALSYGKGALLKLHNSQNKIRKGMLAEIIKFVKLHVDQRPLIFHSNGFLGEYDVIKYENFDAFMTKLSYWSSWSGGMTIWRDDFNLMGKIDVDPLFPHTSVFLTQFGKNCFVIDDRIIYDVQRVHKRGGHNKFEAFTIHYPSLIEDCCSKGLISKECKNMIFNDLCREYIPTLLFNKYIARIETFDASNFSGNSRKFFSRTAIWLIWFNVLFVPFRMLKRKMLRLFACN